MTTILSAFDLGQIVYLKTDPEQRARMVIGISVRQTGIVYGLAHANAETWHYDLEISVEKDILAQTTN